MELTASSSAVSLGSGRPLRRRNRRRCPVAEAARKMAMAATLQGIRGTFFGLEIHGVEVEQVDAATGNGGGGGHAVGGREGAAASPAGEHLAGCGEQRVRRRESPTMGGGDGCRNWIPDLRDLGEEGEKGRWLCFVGWAHFSANNFHLPA